MLLTWFTTYVPSVDFMFSTEKILTEGEFHALVGRLVSAVDILPWIWSKAPGTYATFWNMGFNI